ncbi:MAG: RDD family protein [Arcanobacterium sp.]|nr:RDD family protein [Arcanobacterium sp.]
MRKRGRNMSAYDQLRSAGLFGEEIITGEAVALEMPYATVATRIASAMVDVILYVLLGALTIYVIASNASALSGALARTLYVLTLALWVWIVPAVVAIITRGCSLGKWITGTRIVRADGGAMQPTQSFVRSLVGIFELWITFGVVALAVVALSRRAQRLGDMLAGTYVVKWPRRRISTDPYMIAPPLAHWASIVQTRELPAGLTLNMSAFLRSIKRLDPRMREEQARFLAASAEPYVHPSPPHGTPAEEFLEAVLALRFNVETEANQKTLQRRNAVYEQLRNQLVG